MQAKIHFVGHTARAPYFFPNGDKDTRCAKFTVITNDGKNAKGEDRSSAHNCTAFGKTADLACWYLHVGKQVAINGRSTTMRKETGKIRPDGSAEVYYESTTLVDSIELLADSQKWIADSKAKGLLPQDYGMPGVVTERGKIQDYVSGPSYGFATVWEKGAANVNASPDLLAQLTALIGGGAQPSTTTGHPINNPSGVTDSLDANALAAALLTKKQEAVAPPAQNPAALALLQTLLEQKTSPATAVESATAPINPF
jgi:single-stranded DNA-binding protein